MTKAEIRNCLRLSEEKIKQQNACLAMIRNRAMNAIDGSRIGGAVKWREELAEIARLAVAGRPQ
jgi:hypothetical protein